MTDLRGAIGREYTLDPVIADADSMVAYALATNDPNPRYIDVDRVGGIVAPPLYPVRIVHPLIFKCVTDPLLDLDLLRVVHGEEDLTWHGPLRAGDLVHRRGVLEFISQKGSGVVAGWRMYLEVDGELRVEVLNTVFARKAEMPGMEPGDTYGSAPRRRAAAEGEATVLGAPMPVDPDQADRYAVASLDDNPIHVNDEVARKVGLPGVILHGLCTMAFTSRAVVDGLLDGDNSRLKRLSVRFSKPVLPGQTLTVHATDGGTGYHLSVTNEQGDVVASSGWARIS
jgi:acyl dehydratase